jgi:hypothetical protein
MYVNISPADYNLEETLTSLAYAARVKLITNDAAKNEESKEVHRCVQRTERTPSSSFLLFGVAIVGFLCWWCDETRHHLPRRARDKRKGNAAAAF